MQTLPSGDPALERQLEEQLAQTRHLQDRLAVLLEPHASTHEGDQTEWPLRGEILSHVDRLRTALRLDDLPTRQALEQPAPLHRGPARRSPIRRGASRPAGIDHSRPHGTGQHQDKPRSSARPEAIRSALSRRGSM